jgi:Fur family transcriptional regulator, ferric uptake regulator
MATSPDPRHAIPTALARKGFRLTGPRRAVLDVLVAQAAPLSAAEIHSRVRNRRVNLVSVYRTVHLLAKLGLLRTADTSRRIRRFELAEEFTGHHHHLICRGCGRIEDVDGCLLGDRALEALHRSVRRAQRFRITDHDLKLFGLCHRCDARGSA